MKKLVAALVVIGFAGFAQTAFAQDGEAIYKKSGCIACHTVDGKGGKVGPSLDGVGKKGKDYIRENIVNPNSTVTPGYAANIMPQNFGKTLKPDELNALVDWLATK